MKITLGYWRTANGSVWHIDYTSGYGSVGHNKDGDVAMWNYANHRVGYGLEHNLVGLWIDPVPWDWSTTPMWLNYLAMDDDLEWMLYADKPERTPTGWRTDGPYCDVPPAFWPKWSSDWRQSLTVRPGYKEAK